MERALTFDTLAYSKRLTDAGFTQKQAEVQAETLAEIIEQNIATKRDLKELEFRLIIKLGTIMATSIAIIVALVKLV
jgi:hypothetical protein